MLLQQTSELLTSIVHRISVCFNQKKKPSTTDRNF